MLDRAAFLRPMAHRGLHDVGRGIIENTASAFTAAIGKGYGIECDLRHRAASSDRIISFADFLDLVAGRVPLLVEIKSEWAPPDAVFLRAIADQVTTYPGPLALMSFDPAVMAAFKTLAPVIPRGIVAGLFEGPGWWLDKLGKERAFRLSHLLESRPAQPQFFSYDVRALPTPVTRFVREVLHIPLFTWTVRTPQERTVAAQWADAITFEGFEP
jgi:glycerophosphoryl diester phosphodiesterase